MAGVIVRGGNGLAATVAGTGENLLATLLGEAALGDIAAKLFYWSSILDDDNRASFVRPAAIGLGALGRWLRAL